MVQKYQNESAPIFYYGKSPKTNRKHLKIPYLQALTLGHVIKMTLYFFKLTKQIKDKIIVDVSVDQSKFQRIFGIAKTVFAVRGGLFLLWP